MTLTTGGPVAGSPRLEPEARRATRRRVVVGSGALAALAATGVASTLAACGGETGSVPQVGTTPATVRWFSRAAYQQATLDSWLAQWNAVQPRIKVEVTLASGGTGPAKEKLLTMLAGGETPDVVSAFTAAYLMRDVVQPIEDLVKRDKYETKQFEPKNFEAAAKYQGKVYMLPQGFG